MEEHVAAGQLVEKVKQYPTGRAKDVARGAETPRLAALLVQKYGCGVADAMTVIFGSPRAADAIFKVVDEEIAKLDPHWREHERERWAGRQADVTAPGRNE